MAKIECKTCGSSDCNGCNIYLLRQMLRAGKFDTIKDWDNTIIPAADVVPVVRCGECKHWKRIRNDCILASCELDALVRSEDFFCADGERKEGDVE